MAREKVQLHLGCGDRRLPAFVNVDVRPLPGVDLVARVDDLCMFADGSVDLIYACHILEHFGRHDVDGVLDEWSRVLKEGGVLRLAVPDFESLVDVYIEYKDLSLIIGPLYGRQDHEWNFHKVGFDFATLKAKLEAHGFENVRRYDYNETIHKDHDDYSQAYIPHMDKRGILISLNVEADKARN